MKISNINKKHYDYILMTLLSVGVILMFFGYPQLLNLMAMLAMVFMFCKWTFFRKQLEICKECEGKHLEDLNDDSWELKRITPQIFVLTFGNKYDLGMHFLRYQEYYESPNSEFRNHAFELMDFMDWYSKDRNGYFSYPDDWVGYNVPGWVFKELLEENYIRDWNKYDKFMHDRIEDVQKQLPKNSEPWNFYLIGIEKGDEETIAHELAHGLYYTVPEYKQEMDTLTKKYKDVQLCFNKHLVDLGYDETVFVDEFQAYFSTGILPEGKEFLKLQGKNYKQAEDEYQKVFEKWKQRKMLKK